MLSKPVGSRWALRMPRRCSFLFNCFSTNLKCNILNGESDPILRGQRDDFSLSKHSSWGHSPDQKPEHHQRPQESPLCSQNLAVSTKITPVLTTDSSVAWFCPFLNFVGMDSDTTHASFCVWPPFLSAVFARSIHVPNSSGSSFVFIAVKALGAHRGPEGLLW